MYYIIVNFVCVCVGGGGGERQRNGGTVVSCEISVNGFTE